MKFLKNHENEVSRRDPDFLRDPRKLILGYSKRVWSVLRHSGGPAGRRRRFPDHPRADQDTPTQEEVLSGRVPGQPR